MRAGAGAFVGAGAGLSDDNAPVAYSVSLLHSPEDLGVATAEKAAKKLRRGRDSLAVRQGSASAIFLESAIVQPDCTKHELAATLLAEAGIVEEGSASWTTYKTVTWVRGPEGDFEVESGSCRRPPGQAIGPGDLPLLAEHLIRRFDGAGWPAYSLRALEGTYVREGTAARCLHALRVLHDAGRVGAEDSWCSAALPGIEFALSHLRGGTTPNLVIPGHRAGTTAEAYLLGSIAGARPDLVESPEATALAAKLRACIGSDGCILPPRPTKSGPTLTCSRA